MSEKTWRYLFMFGALVSFLVLVVLTTISLPQVKQTRTAPLTDQVVAGKRAWQAKNCNDCHTILGIGGYFAPDMTKISDRRDAAYLVRWVKDPHAVKPETTMPNPGLTDTQAQDLVAFLGWVGKIDTNGWPPQPALPLGATSGGVPGATVYVQLGCGACHRVNGQGASGPGPDLSHIGSQPYDDLPNTPEFLAKWLDDPAAQKPNTTMPHVPMSTPQRDALVEYLVSLK